MPQAKDNNAAPPVAEANLTGKGEEPKYFVLPKDNFPWSDNPECPPIPEQEGTNGHSPAHTHKGVAPNVNWGADN